MSASNIQVRAVHTSPLKDRCNEFTIKVRKSAETSMSRRGMGTIKTTEPKCERCTQIRSRSSTGTASHMKSSSTHESTERHLEIAMPSHRAQLIAVTETDQQLERCEMATESLAISRIICKGSRVAVQTCASPEESTQGSEVNTDGQTSQRCKTRAPVSATCQSKTQHHQVAEEPTTRTSCSRTSNRGQLCQSTRIKSNSHLSQAQLTNR